MPAEGPVEREKKNAAPVLTEEQLLRRKALKKEKRRKEKVLMANPMAAARPSFATKNVVETHSLQRYKLTP